MSYKSPFDARGSDSWHELSLVRTKRSIGFDTPFSAEHQLFSSAQTAYAEHELVLKQDPNATHTLRGYRLADYLAKTERVEIYIVNEAVAAILARDDLPEQMRIDLLKIYTDEGYHVVMLAEFREKLRTATGIELRRRESAEVDEMFAILKSLPTESRSLGYICCAIVTETLITSTLRQSSDSRLYPPVAEMFADHGKDENMHHAFFTRFAEWLLPTLSSIERVLVERLVPQFMWNFLSPGLSRIEADLKSIGLSETQTSKVLRESLSFEAWKSAYLSSSIATRSLFSRLGFDSARKFEQRTLSFNTNHLAWQS